MLVSFVLWKGEVDPVTHFSATSKGSSWVMQDFLVFSDHLQTFESLGFQDDLFIELPGNFTWLSGESCWNGLGNCKWSLVLGDPALLWSPKKLWTFNPSRTAYKFIWGKIVQFHPSFPIYSSLKYEDKIFMGLQYKADHWNDPQLKTNTKANQEKVPCKPRLLHLLPLLCRALLFFSYILF